MESDKDLVIRKATKNDMAAVAEMIQELADFEKMPDGPQLTVKDLQHDGFEKEPPAFCCLVAELPLENRVIGYAVYFPTYSTWQGAAMMLEDLYVRPAQRNRGVGDKLFGAVAEEAWSAGCSRLDFHVLKWNPARSFYGRKGALDLTETEDWCYYRLAAPPAPPAAGRPPRLDCSTSVETTEPKDFK